MKKRESVERQMREDLQISQPSVVAKNMGVQAWRDQHAGCVPAKRQQPTGHNLFANFNPSKYFGRQTFFVKKSFSIIKILEKDEEQKYRF
jgi:hypothetical protein